MADRLPAPLAPDAAADPSLAAAAPTGSHPAPVAPAPEDKEAAFSGTGTTPAPDPPASPQAEHPPLPTRTRPREVEVPRAVPAAAPEGPAVGAGAHAVSATATMPIEMPAVPARHPADSMEGLSERLRAAETRDEVFESLLDFTAARFRRCALFVVQQGRVIGWSGRGEGISPARIRNVTVGFDLPSLFVFFRKGGDYYFGPVPDLPANARFYRDLGCPPPSRVLLMPLKIKERAAVILYADNLGDLSASPDVPLFRRALHKASLALEILILKSKIMML